MSRDPLEQPARPERVAALDLPEAARARALDLAGEGPDLATWRALLRGLLLYAGAGLVLAGVVCFFAFNWQGLHRFAKFALAALGILACAGGAWRLGLARAAAKVLLLAACALVGVWLAIHGQAYQTGADAYELFRGWALLVLPWVLLARFQGLWTFWLLLLNLWLGLWWDQAGPEQETLLPAAFAALNGAAWVLRELGEPRLPWLTGRWLPRLLALATLAALLLPALAALAGGRADYVVPAAFVLALLQVALFRWLRRDLFLVTLGLAALIALLTTALGRLLLKNWLARDGACGAVLLLGLLLTAQVGGAAAWLRRLAREVP